MSIQDFLAGAIIFAFVIFIVFPAFFGGDNISYKDAVIGGAAISFGLMAIFGIFAAVIWAFHQLGAF